jgi:hypothetical protein
LFGLDQLRGFVRRQIEGCLGRGWIFQRIRCQPRLKGWREFLAKARPKEVGQPLVRMYLVTLSSTLIFSTCE